MSSSFPNGTIFSIGTTYGSPKTITQITNDNPGVATSATHGLSSGDILLLSMPSRLDQRVARVDNEDTNTFEIEGINTTSTSLYPSGFGVGTAQEVTDFVPLSQITDAQSSGGDQNFYNWVYLEDGRQRQRPTFKNARSLAITLDYDPDLAWHAELIAASEAGTVKVFKATLPDGAVLYYSFYVGYDGEPTFTINENQKTQLTLSYAAPYHIRYDA